MKKVLGVILVLLVLAGGAAWYFTTFKLDGMIKQGIEQAGADALGTRVSVGAVETNLREGSLSISNITVANPPGYNNENAFSLNNIEAALNYENFDIKRVIINEPEIIVEERNGETNISELMEGLQGASSEPDPAADGKEPPVLVIHHFRMEESRAAFESASLDRYTDLEVDAVELNNLKGTPDEIAKAIATEVLGEITKEAAVELLKAKASEKFDNIFGRDKD